MNVRNIIASVMVVSSTTCLLSIPANAAQNPKQPLTVQGQPLVGSYKLVGYSDINLNDEIGVDRLQRRVHQASNSLCKSEGRLTLGQIVAGNRCYRDAIAYAAPQVADAIERFRTNDMASLKPIQVASRK